jgi:hypothetical protein
VAVDGYEEFAAALDDLWADPAHWRSLGRSGREYVRKQFGDPAAFDARWQAALDNMDVPLAQQLQQNGRQRAAAFDRPAWREQLGQVIERVLDAPPRPRLDALEVRPRTANVAASTQQGHVLVPVRLRNRGRHAEAAEGPARTELTAGVYRASGEPRGPTVITALPDLLLPGRDQAAVVRVAVPTEPGEYHVRLGYRRLRPNGEPAVGGEERPVSAVALTVTAEAQMTIPPPTVPANLEPVLRAAASAQQLPDGYADVSEGWAASWKRWLKHKLLHNFRHAYVDVLSRQQSAFNRQVLNALMELADGQAALAHAADVRVPRPDDGLGDLRAELRRLRRQNQRLRRRLSRVEDSAAPERPCVQEDRA